MKLVVSLLLASVLACAEAPRLLHKVSPKYPPDAKMAKVQGTVMLEVNISAKGIVQDARVLSGPMELRRAAMEAVLQWQYEPISNDALAQVTINFTLTDDGPAPPPLGTIRSIEFENVNDMVKKRILGRLSLKAGDLMNAGDLGAIQIIASEIERGLRVSFTDMVLRFDASPVIRIGGNVQASKLTKQIAPLYPALAKQARIQGTVRLTATIDRDGKIVNLELVSGHPLLTTAAVDAVKQWEYEKTMLNGQPVAVITQIDVNFTLAPQTTANQQ